MSEEQQDQKQQCPIERFVWAFWKFVALLAVVCWVLNAAAPERPKEARGQYEDPYAVLYPELTPVERDALKRQHKQREQENLAALKQRLIEEARR